jgi:hypothetical protein
MAASHVAKDQDLEHATMALQKVASQFYLEHPLTFVQGFRLR